MKITQSRVLPPDRMAEMGQIGAHFARLRIAKRMTQAQAALRAGISRTTAYRIEQGDAGLAIGQLLRYLDAIAPGKTLLGLLQEDDPSLIVLEASERRKRVRELSREELEKLDF